MENTGKLPGKTFDPCSQKEQQGRNAWDSDKEKRDTKSSKENGRIKIAGNR